MKGGKGSNKTSMETLPLVENFYTIQGEGFNAGKPAWFIRLGGCDVRCSLCDSKNTWDASQFPCVTIDEIIRPIRETSVRNVVITGGEPLMYSLDSLCIALKKEDYEISLETSGTHPLSGTFDWICLSPKKHCPPSKCFFEKASEIKIVISTEDDLKWAEENRKKVSKKCIAFLQPDWNRRDSATKLIVDYVKENPEWRISLQTHKFMNIP